MAVVEKEWKGGVLLFAGGTDWSQLGRSGGKGKKDPKDEVEREQLYPNLYEPTRWKTLTGIRIAFVAAGPAAVHCIAGDVDGRLYTWGRNEKGQLGHNDTIQRNNPKVVEDLAGKPVAGGSGGRFHTVVYTRDGESFAFGSNVSGQLGVGTIKKYGKVEDLHIKPSKCLVTQVTGVAAGIDFTMWISDGKLYSAGNPQHGQLGDGSDHSYNAKDSSIAIVYDPQPTPKLVGTLATKTITRVTCGHNHGIAVDDEGSAYTWGNGGYGRLGHRVQQDEFNPRRLEEFKGRVTVPPTAEIAAGNTGSFCNCLIGGQMSQLYAWGKLKTSGDNQMYPAAEQNLSGWNVRSISCGPATFAIAADNSVITWGMATNGELGYGVNGKKSSANPAKCEPLEGMRTHQVACGVGFTMFLVDPDAPQLAKMPEFECHAPEEDVGPADLEDAAGGRGRGRGGAGSKRKAAEPAARGRGRGKKAK